MKKKILSFIQGVTPKSKVSGTMQPPKKADLPVTTPPNQYPKIADTATEPEPEPEPKSEEPMPDTVNPPAEETDKGTNPGMKTQA